MSVEPVVSACLHAKLAFQELTHDIIHCCFLIHDDLFF
jgi:hypothetical protein